MVNHLLHAEQWYLCKLEAIADWSAAGATCTYATADWLSAVDGDYKKTDATTMSSIGLGGGLGRRTDRQKPIVSLRYSILVFWPFCHRPYSSFCLTRLFVFLPYLSVCYIRLFVFCWHHDTWQRFP